MNLTEEVSPGEIVFDFDAPAAYLEEGGGSIGDPALLEKSGTGTLTLATANSFTGPVDLLGGTLLMEDPEALGAPSGGVEAAPGTVLDINGYAVGAEALALDGAALLNSFPNSATYGGGITFVGGASQVEGDGLTNFTEYAFGLDPTGGASVSPATAPATTVGTFSI